MTFKNRFIAILVTTDPSLPMHLCCRLIAQALLTLKLFRISKINPKLSTEAQLNGNFYYNIMPLVPSGTAVVAHEKPSQQGLWNVHGYRGS